MSLFFAILGILSTPVSWVKGYCSLHIVKHISTLCNNFSIEAVLEQGIKAVEVLIGETNCIEFM